MSPELMANYLSTLALLCKERHHHAAQVEKFEELARTACAALGEQRDLFRAAQNAANRLAEFLCTQGADWEELKELAGEARRCRDEDEARILFGSGVPL